MHDRLCLIENITVARDLYADFQSATTVLETRLDGWNGGKLCFMDSGLVNDRPAPNKPRQVRLSWPLRRSSMNRPPHRPLYIRRSPRNRSHRNGSLLFRVIISCIFMLWENWRRRDLPGVAQIVFVGRGGYYAS